jgi:hypothetical protein
VVHLSLDMSISREDFLRLLPVAVGQAAIAEVAGQFSGSEGPRSWTLQLLPLAQRRLGSVALPRHQVDLRLEGYSDSEAAAFMARFHQGFQRGGG